MGARREQMRGRGFYGIRMVFREGGAQGVIDAIVRMWPNVYKVYKIAPCISFFLSFLSTMFRLPSFSRSVPHTRCVTSSGADVSSEMLARPATTRRGRWSLP